MSTNPTIATFPPAATPPRSGLLKRAARGTLVAGAIASLCLGTFPSTAQAGGPGVGAAIGLGILGGVLAGAAIASTAPVYAQPSPYYYPNAYAPPSPAYGPAPQPYYGPAPATYPPAYYSYGDPR